MAETVNYEDIYGNAFPLHTLWTTKLGYFHIIEETNTCTCI